MVSRIGLGTMTFGFTTDEATSFAIMDAGSEAGINFFDTADVYGGPQKPDMTQGYGIAEEVVGRWLQRSGRRDEIVLATKVYQPMGPGPNGRGLSAYHIRRACEASLRRLKTDHIHLYQMHHVDRATPWEEIWQAMEQLVREGKVSYVGSSNFAAWDVALAQSAASAHHFLGLVSEQSHYSLAVRDVELELVPALRHLGIGLIPYSPLRIGLLAGALENVTEGREVNDSLLRLDRGTSRSTGGLRVVVPRVGREARGGCAGLVGGEPCRFDSGDRGGHAQRTPIESRSHVGAVGHGRVDEAR